MKIHRDKGFIILSDEDKAIVFPELNAFDEPISEVEHIAEIELASKYLYYQKNLAPEYLKRLAKSYPDYRFIPNNTLKMFLGD
jgi:hypothetical protein